MVTIDDIDFERERRKAALSVRAYHFEKYRADFVNGAWVVPGSEQDVLESEQVPEPEPIVDRSAKKVQPSRICKDCDATVVSPRQRCPLHAARHDKARNNQKTKEYYYAKMAEKRPCGWRQGCENPIAFRSRMCRECITFRRRAEKSVALPCNLPYTVEVDRLIPGQL